MIPRLDPTAGTRVLVLTGAGVSAESGIPTFRGSGGLWEGHRVEDVASPEGFRADPLQVWRFYSERRATAAACAPNTGHAALAALEQKLGDRFLLVTQNVDGFHRAAGSERVIELHGNLFQTRCAVCDRPPFDDRDLYAGDRLPVCGRCQARGELSPLRPHIVWFGERLDPVHLQRIEVFLRARAERLVFLAVGTSGSVSPAAELVSAARGLGAETWLINADEPKNVGDFDHVHLGQSGALLPAWVA